MTELDPERFKADELTEEINGINYTSIKVPTMTGLKLMARVISVLGESGLRAVVTGSPLMRTIIRNAGVNAMAAFVEIADGLSRDPRLPLELLASVKCATLRPAGQGGSINESTFNLHFKGEYPHLLSVCEFVLRHNFSGFTLGSHLTDGTRTNPQPGQPTADPSS